MESGRDSISPIIQAIQDVEEKTTAKIQVHISKRWIEKDAYRRAKEVFLRYRMDLTKERNAVLIYVNLRRRKLAIIGDIGIHEKVDQNYWNIIVDHLKENLKITENESAIALAVLEIGETLHNLFPKISPPLADHEFIEAVPQN